MKIIQLAGIEKQLMEEVVRRRKLGGYSMEAEGILLMGEALLKIVGHLIDEYPADEKTSDDKK